MQKLIVHPLLTDIIDHAILTEIGCGDGTIRIFNVFTGKQSYVLNTAMEEPMPTTNIKY